MSADHFSATWPRRLSLSRIAAPVARLVDLARREPRRPFYPCEIDRFRRELDMKRTHADLQARFKAL